MNLQRLVLRGKVSHKRLHKAHFHLGGVLTLTLVLGRETRSVVTKGQGHAEVGGEAGMVTKRQHKIPWCRRNVSCQHSG